MHWTCILIACTATTLPSLMHGAEDSVDEFLSIYRAQATKSPIPPIGSQDLLKYAKDIHAVAFSNDVKLRDPKSSQILGFDRRAALIQSVIGTVSNGFHETMRYYCEDYPQGCGPVTPPSLYKRVKNTNELLEELYSRLIEALTNATTKLGRNETFGDDEVCAPDDAKNILCEMEVLQAMLTGECDNITIRHCLNGSANVERCIIREAGTLYTTKKIVRFRVVHLLSAYGMCNSVTDWTDEIAPMATKITEALANASWRLENVSWTHPAERIAIEVMNKLPELGWPESSAYSAKYDNVTHALDKALAEEWGDDTYKSFDFYGCGKTDCYSFIGRLASNKRETSLVTTPWLKHSVHFIRKTGINAAVWRRMGASACNESERKQAWDRIISHGLDSYTKRLGAHTGSSSDKCFPAAVVVKCAYRFVWQELSWTYFHATSNRTYAIQAGTKPYKPCACTVLLP